MEISARMTVIICWDGVNRTSYRIVKVVWGISNWDDEKHIVKFSSGPPPLLSTSLSTTAVLSATR